MSRRLLTPILAASLICIGGTAGAEGGKKGEDAGPKVGDAAPRFTLKTMNAKRAGMRVFGLRNYVGDGAKTPKTVVLSFAASYCEPCKKELAELGPMYPEFERAGVKLAVVVIDTEKDAIEKMRALTVDKLDLQFPVLSDRFQVLARRYAASALPKTVVITPDGTIKWISTGFKEGAVAALKAQVGM